MLSDDKRSKLWSMYQKELKSPPPSPMAMQMPMITANNHPNNLKSPQQRLSYIDTFRLALGENVESFPVEQSTFMNMDNTQNNTFDTTTTTAYDTYDGMDLHALADSKLTVETNVTSSSSSSSENDKDDKKIHYNYDNQGKDQYLSLIHI